MPNTTQLTYTIAFRSKVVSVEEKMEKQWIAGTGDKAMFHTSSKGWYIGLERSHELLFAGDTRPSINPGDEAIIRINFYAAATVPGSPR